MYAPGRLMAFLVGTFEDLELRFWTGVYGRSSRSFGNQSLKILLAPFWSLSDGVKAL